MVRTEKRGLLHPNPSEMDWGFFKRCGWCNLKFWLNGCIIVYMKNVKENTLKEASVRCLVYQLPDDMGIYYATALEFNLTVSA